MSTVTKGQRNLLLFILGIAIIFLPIRFLAMGNFDDKKNIDSEKAERQTYYNDLKAKDNNRQQYIDDTAFYKAEYEELLKQFPAEIYQDNTIMYLQGIKDEYKLDFPSVTMGEETLFYTLGSGAVGDVSLDTEPAENEETSENGEMVATANGYNCYSATFPVTYTGDYNDIKSVIDYIKDGDFRMTLDEISISFNDNEGYYEGNLVFTSYAVNGGDRTTDHADVNVQTGTNNIFGNPTVKQTVTTGDTTAE